MFFESFPAHTCDDIFGVGFFANKGFFYFDVFCIFKGFGMACQISIGNVQKFLKPIEIHLFVHHKNGHDAQSYAMVKQLVYVINKSHFMPYPLLNT